jgi:hypothetical protein
MHAILGRSPFVALGDDAAMDMDAYLDEIQFAVQSTLPLLWAERDRVAQLETEVAALTAEMKSDYERAEKIAQSEVPDDDGLATMIYWETYFGPDKEQNEKGRELREVEQRLEAHSFSLAALAGAVLQNAKQGISIVHGQPANAPDGRSIGSLSLRTVIWEGRNQAIHWEDGPLRPAGANCFAALASEQDAKFAEHGQRSLAMDCIALLGWRDFEAFAADMRSLA